MCVCVYSLLFLPLSLLFIIVLVVLSECVAFLSSAFCGKLMSLCHSIKTCNKFNATQLCIPGGRDFRVRGAQLRTHTHRYISIYFIKIIWLKVYLLLWHSSNNTVLRVGLKLRSAVNLIATSRVVIIYL